MKTAVILLIIGFIVGIVVFSTFRDSDSLTLGCTCDGAEVWCVRVGR